MTRSGYIVNRAALPKAYPTHRHAASFWEALGRSVATFGFLEDALCKAIFALTATTEHEGDEIEEAYRKWLPTLERAFSDPLGNLIDVYAKALRNHQDANIENLEDLIEDLRSAASLRNVICHGSWPPPDASGAAIPFYVNKQGEIFSTAVDIAFLAQLRTSTLNLACSVVDTVTHMGWQFPSTGGPGEVIWQPTGKQ